MLSRKQRLYKFLKPGLFQFSIVVFLSIFILIYDNSALPNSMEISDYFIHLYETYGLIIIVLAAFLEGLFMLSMYLPASLVIVLSAFALGFDIWTLTKIGLLSILGFTCVNILNYYLGRYGYHKLLLKLGGKESIKKIQSDFNNNQFKTIFLTAFHPNFLAITMVSAGIAKSNLLKVIIQSVISLIFWISLWMSLIIFLFKDSKLDLTENENIGYYFVLILFLWGLSKCIISYIKKNNT